MASGILEYDPHIPHILSTRGIIPRGLFSTPFCGHLSLCLVSSVYTIRYPPRRVRVQKFRALGRAGV